MRRLCLLAVALPAIGLGQTDPDRDIYKLDLEDLTKVKVTTASKSAQPLSEVPSAIYLIRSEDIRRSGATCIPEALRLAPGVNVAQIDGNKWMVSIRGFNNRFSDKLLVLIDGQSIYTPLFSGVYWDAHALPLSEVDRIEVIRGPGGSLWGANAVNGVVNIITKSASQTQGGYANLEAGSEFNQIGGHYGGRLGAGFYRAYANTFDSKALTESDGHRGPEGFKDIAAGFKYEQGAETGDKFLFKADFQSEHLGQRSPIAIVTPPFVNPVDSRFGVSSVDSVLRWERNEVSGRSQSLQLSFEHYDRTDSPDATERRDTVDLDYQAQFAPVGAHTFSVGAGYRNSRDWTGGVGIVSFDPASYTERTYSAFLHDSVRLSPTWKVLAGSKFVHTPYTGWEVQPNLQFLHTPNDRTSYWYSISRAVRTPSRADENVSFSSTTVPGTPPTLLLFGGNPNFASEVVVANEIGARFELRDGAFVDLTSFVDHYTNLRTFEPGVPYLDGTYAVQPVTFGNGMSGDTAGFEVAVKKKVTPAWSLEGNFALFTERLRLDPGSKDTLGLYLSDGRGGAAKNQFQIHSNLDFGKNFEFDNSLYYVGPLINGTVCGYYKLDSRLGWTPTKDLQFSLGVRNALSPQTVQAGEATFETVGSVPRSIYLRMDWKF